MLTELVESRARPARRRGGTAASVAVHALVIGAAVAATGGAEPRPAEPPPDVLIYHAPAPPPPSAPARATGVAAGPSAAPAAPRLPAVPAVPGVEIPPIDAAVDAAAHLAPDAGFEARGLRADGWGASATPGALGSPGAALDEAAVDEPVVPDPRNPPPRYPESLRAAGLGGRVTARFVVDTLGRVEPGSVAFVAGGDQAAPALEAAVREALARSRFRPARAGGHRVRQLAERPYVFSPGPR